MATAAAGQTTTPADLFFLALLKAESYLGLLSLELINRSHFMDGTLCGSGYEMHSSLVSFDE